MTYSAPSETLLLPTLIGLKIQVQCRVKLEQLNFELTDINIKNFKCYLNRISPQMLLEMQEPKHIKHKDTKLRLSTPKRAQAHPSTPKHSEQLLGTYGKLLNLK